MVLYAGKVRFRSLTTARISSNKAHPPFVYTTRRKICAARSDETRPKSRRRFLGILGSEEPWLSVLQTLKS